MDWRTIVPYATAGAVAGATVALILQQKSKRLDSVALTRARVSEVVRLYGEAWVAQDSDRILKIFTHDAEYCERVMDNDGTFTGHAAIKEYWERQICGKQKDIQFKQVDEEMVLDSERQTAVVKWIATFQNFSRDGIYNKVTFVQVAVLTFKGGFIQRLEEYWHSPTKGRRDRRVHKRQTEGRGNRHAQRQNKKTGTKQGDEDAKGKAGEGEAGEGKAGEESDQRPADSILQWTQLDPVNCTVLLVVVPTGLVSAHMTALLTCYLRYKPEPAAHRTTFLNAGIHCHR
jgi:hypothetical protein